MSSSTTASSTTASGTTSRQRHDTEPTSPTRPSGPAGPTAPAGSGDVYVLPAEDFHVVAGRGVDRADRDVAPGQRVTSARGSHADDVARRMRTYAISMGIRTLCVLGAVLSFPHWWAWLFVPGAVLLPYVAVVLANVGGERVPVALAAVPPSPDARAALPTSGPV